MMPKNGTVLDIVKYMRSLAESLGTKRRVNIPTITVMAWFGLCQELEAAARRDNKAARDAIYREAEKNARKALEGDTAKLREALENVRDWLVRANKGQLDALATSKFIIGARMVNDPAKSVIEGNEFHVGKIDEALAEPPRNCDRFATLDDAREAFQKIRGHRVWWRRRDVEEWDSRGEIGVFLRWLFDTATHENGGTP